MRTGQLAAKVQQPQREEPVNPMPDVEVVVPEIPDSWVFPEDLTARYGRANIQALHRWWTTVGDSAVRSTAAPVWVSGTFLCLDFLATMRVEGPFQIGRKWFTSKRELPVGREFCWTERSKTFLILLKIYLKKQGMVLASKMARPISAVLALWGVCYKLPWDRDRMQFIDDQLFEQFHRQISVPHDVQQIEPITFPVAWQLSM